MNTLTSLRIGLGLSIAYLREKPLATLLNTLLLALGVATIIALLLVLRLAEERLERDSAGVDLVIGAKGSPLQLVLSSVFQIDIPTGNIPMKEAAAIIALPMVKRAIPLAQGDSYRGFRIVGTDPRYAELYQAKLASGAFWSQPLQAVLGADVARATRLGVGAKFAGAHGLSDAAAAHADHPYQVVGVLAATGSVIDRLILTSVASIWAVHDHTDSAEGRELTAYLIQYASPLAAASFPRMVNASSSLQAASPALESARLFSLLGLGVTAMKLFAVVMIVCAGLGIFVGLMGALHERRADLALLRLLGAGPGTIVITILGQGLLLGVGGVILGTALGHAGAEWIGVTMHATHRVALTGFGFVAEELLVIGAALGLALVASSFPAWRAYREALPAALAGR